MNILIHGMEYQDALEFVKKNDIIDTYEEMQKGGYTKKRLIV